MKNLNEPRALREIHDIRLANYERTKHMSPEERSRLLQEETQDVIARMGIQVTLLAPSEQELKRM